MDIDRQVVRINYNLSIPVKPVLRAVKTYGISHLWYAEIQYHQTAFKILAPPGSITWTASTARLYVSGTLSLTLSTER